MNRPKDIPEDVWEIARELLGEPDTVTRPKNIERAARALMAYGQRRADDATERAAQACEMNYLANPILLATAIRSQK
jgi:hypothetical protein